MVKKCKFGILSKYHFDNILKEFEEQKILKVNYIYKKLNKSLEYFATLPLCYGWNSNLIKYIYLNAFSKTLTRREIVYDQDTEPEGFYIVKEGTFVVNKKYLILIDYHRFNKKFDKIDKYDYSF